MVGLALVLWLMGGHVAEACTVCFNSAAENQSAVRATNMFIIFLLTLTGIVLSGLIGFIFHLRKMSRKATKGIRDMMEEGMVDVDPREVYVSVPMDGEGVSGCHSPLWHLEHSHSASGRDSLSYFGMEGRPRHGRASRHRKENPGWGN